jgi:hypothetical protein
MVNGSDCVIRLKTGNAEAVIPFLSETLREKVFFSEEYAAIEGEGWRGGLAERAGTEGGVTTALTLDSAPAILGAAFGKNAGSFYISGTRNLYRRVFRLCAADEAPRFFLHERKGAEEKVYPECFCKAFELRVERDGAVRLHIDIGGDAVVETHVTEPAKKIVTDTERFKERGVAYFIDGKKYNSIYRFVLYCDKNNGCRTSVLIYRYLNIAFEPPDFIENLTLQANLFRDIYEPGQHGKFAVTLKDLRLLSDDTEVCAADAVIGALRYSVCGGASADAFTNEELGIRN